MAVLWTGTTPALGRPATKVLPSAKSERECDLPDRRVLGSQLHPHSLDSVDNRRHLTYGSVTFAGTTAMVEKFASTSMTRPYQTLLVDLIPICTHSHNRYGNVRLWLWVRNIHLWTRPSSPHSTQEEICFDDTQSPCVRTVCRGSFRRTSFAKDPQ